MATEAQGFLDFNLACNSRAAVIPMIPALVVGLLSAKKIQNPSLKIKKNTNTLMRVKEIWVPYPTTMTRQVSSMFLKDIPDIFLRKKFKTSVPVGLVLL
jgi:hypothetical protein